MNGEKESEEEECSEEASPVFLPDNPPENDGDVERYENIPKKDITCFDCPDTGTCEYAFDPYNTHGDCLADK